MRTSLRWMLAVVTIVGCVAAAGCASSEKEQQEQEKKDRQAARRLERQRQRDADAARTPDPVIGRSDDRVDRDTRRTSRGLDEIPTTATRVDEGGGPRLTFTTSRDGTLYVYDADDDRVIYSGGVRADDRFAMDPADNRATVNGHTVLGAKLNPNHRYRVYFDRER